jgi:hypothetical protein
MTKRILSIALIALSTGAAAQAQDTPTIHKGFVNIGLIYPLSTTGLNAPHCANYFSANAIAGISYDELSFCGAGVSNIVKHDAKGVIAAGFSNHIMNEATGFQAAGFANTVKRHTKGLQAAGFFNYSGSVKGAQFAGFANFTRGEVKGLQAAGFSNMASDADVQLAGFFNRAYNTHTQFAGFINVAHTVKGAQVSGFINIADSCDYPIGFVNIIKDGERNLGVTVDESLTTMVSFRSGGRRLYGILGIGANLQEQPGSLFNEGDMPYYALEGGIGLHMLVSRNFKINLEGVGTHLTDFTDSYYVRSSLRIMPSLTVAQHLEIFAGPTVNVEVTHINSGTGMYTNYIWGTGLWNSTTGIYVGAIGGLAYKF